MDLLFLEGTKFDCYVTAGKNRSLRQDTILNIYCSKAKLNREDISELGKEINSIMINKIQNNDKF